MRRERSRFTVTFCSITLAGVAFAADANAACSRAMLTKLTDTYVKAQTDGKPSMVPLANGAYYGQNDVAMDIAKGVLAAPLKIDFTAVTEVMSSAYATRFRILPIGVKAMVTAALDFLHR